MKPPKVISPRVFMAIFAFGVVLVGQQDSAAAPNGTISFLSDRDSEPPHQGGATAVYLIEADGSNERKWLEEPEASFSRVAWSPDGSEVAFHLETDFDIHIYTMDVRTEKRKNVTEHLRNHEFLGPTWSWDGRWLAFSSPQQRGKSDDIYVMALAGKAAENLTNRPEEYDGLADWSPNSSIIAYTSIRSGWGEIYTIDQNRGDPVNLTNHPAGDLGPSWSPDGKKIAFYSNRQGRQDDIYVMNTDGSNVVNLTNHPSEDRMPAWAPDGRWIAFQSTRAQIWNIYIMDTNGDSQTQLTNHPSVNSRPSWVDPDSPFSSSIDSQGKLPTVWGHLKSRKR